MRNRIIAALAALACIGVSAAPASAYNSAQWTKAMQTLTNDCLAHQGCHAVQFCSTSGTSPYAYFYGSYRTTYGLVGRSIIVSTNGTLIAYQASGFCG